jgi:hypothetical protein
MTSHAQTRATNKMYGHPSSQKFRTEERDAKKPPDPVAARRTHYRDEEGKMIDRQRREKTALESDINREKIRDPLDRKAHLADARRKDQAEKHKTEREHLGARRDRDIEETARKNPVA